MTAESADGVVAHEAGAGGKALFVVTGGPDDSTLAEELLGYIPQGARGGVEHQVFGAVADVEAVARAVEVGIAAVCGPLRHKALCFRVGGGGPGLGVVAVPAGHVDRNGLPHLVADAGAERGVECTGEDEIAVALELFDLVGAEKGDLGDSCLH